MARKYHREIISEKPSPDGRGVIITEKDVRCTGSDCRHCESQHSRRPSQLDTTRPYSAVEERLPTPYEFDFRPDPAAKERRRDKSHRDHDRSYGEGDRFTLGRSCSMRGPSDPIAIPRTPHRRSKSMYEDDMYDKYYSSRPTIHQDSGYYRDSRYPPTRSARIPLGFYEVLASSRSGKHSSDRRRSASPLDAPQKTEEYDPERRRLRSKSNSKSKHAPVISYGTDPLLPAFEPASYGSTGRRYSMDSSATRSRSNSFSASSPPKSVRFRDDPRLAQNQRISSRSSRRNSVLVGVGTGADTTATGVKGILKHSNNYNNNNNNNNSNPLTPPSSPPTTHTAAPVQPLSSDQYAELYKSAQGIGVDDRPTTPQRQVQQERSAEIEGLRKRFGNYGMADEHRYSTFESPPRRFGGAWGEKASTGRRSERFYDGMPSPPQRRDSCYY